MSTARVSRARSNLFYAILTVLRDPRTNRIDTRKDATAILQSIEDLIDAKLATPATDVTTMKEMAAAVREAEILTYGKSDDPVWRRAMAIAERARGGQ